MKNPFPGMNPYLEGYIWPDVHHRMATFIADNLASAIAPNYLTQIELYTVQDTAPALEKGGFYPDVSVLLRENKAEEPSVAYANKSTSISKKTLSIAHPKAIPVRIPIVKIINRNSQELITAIEIISPVNKRKPGLQPYREKRQKLYESGVHLLEIDLLRRGERALEHAQLPKSDYMVSLVRAGDGKTDIWAFNLQDEMPVVPVPLKAPDADVPLHLKAVLDLIYERSRYDLSIDYQEDVPPPDLSKEDLDWMKKLLKIG